MPGVIMMFALFCLFTIEMYLKAKTGGHSHGGPTGQVRGHSHGDATGQVKGAAQHHGTHQGHGQTASVATTATALPPYDVQRMDTQYDNSDREKLFARFVHDILGVQQTDMGRLYFDREEQPEIERYTTGSEMPPWFQVFYSQYVRQREDLREMISVLARSTAGLGAPIQTVSEVEVENKSFVDFDDNVEAGNTIDAAQFKRMNMNITLLEGGILFHSIFVGMTISITTNGFIALLVAIIFHQFFEGLGLGSRIAEIPYKANAAKPWVLVCAFGLTCPIGQVIGLVTRDTYDQSSAMALILVGFFNAL